MHRSLLLALLVLGACREPASVSTTNDASPSTLDASSAHADAGAPNDAVPHGLRSVMGGGKAERARARAELLVARAAASADEAARIDRLVALLDRADRIAESADVRQRLTELDALMADSVLLLREWADAEPGNARLQGMFVGTLLAAASMHGGPDLAVEARRRSIALITRFPDDAAGHALRASICTDDNPDDPECLRESARAKALAPNEPAYAAAHARAIEDFTAPRCAKGAVKSTIAVYIGSRSPKPGLAKKEERLFLEAKPIARGSDIVTAVAFSTTETEVVVDGADTAAVGSALSTAMMDAGAGTRHRIGGMSLVLADRPKSVLAERGRAEPRDNSAVVAVLDGTTVLAVGSLVAAHDGKFGVTGKSPEDICTKVMQPALPPLSDVASP